jgi:polysaccharide export outer membrane protein
MLYASRSLSCRWLSTGLLLAIPLLAAGCDAYRAYPAAIAQDLRPASYRLDTGDQIRVLVFDQEVMSRIYTVDDRGNISVPLIGNVVARGRSTDQLERAIASELRRRQIVAQAEVSVEVAVYRPFFVYGEIRAGGRYLYQPGMNVEMAIATAGGLTERGSDRKFRLTRVVGSERIVADVGLDFPIQPGDTLYVYERWF